MNALLGSVMALESIRQKQAVLASQKQEMERQAWMASSRTISHARKLLADATLSLLSKRVSIGASSLEQEIERIATARVRFAVYLCRDWLGDPGIDAG